MVNLVYLQKAKDDLEEIYFHISADSEQAAQKMTNTILNSIEQLTEFPQMGVAVDKAGIIKGYRMLVVKPYLVFYRIIQEDIFIYRILHGKRYFKALLD